mgnify:CR=1 FL=1
MICEKLTKINIPKRINQINTQLPLFYSILETMVKKQEEQVINIKLPINIEFIIEVFSPNNI